MSDIGPVYAVQVGGGAPVGICGTLIDAEALIVRYLALCWPKAETTPAETYDFPDRTERYHRIPPGNYSGGAMLPVTVRTVHLWTQDQHWPAEVSRG